MTSHWRQREANCVWIIYVCIYISIYMYLRFHLCAIYIELMHCIYIYICLYVVCIYVFIHGILYECSIYIHILCI